MRLIILVIFILIIPISYHSHDSVHNTAFDPGFEVQRVYNFSTLSSGSVPYNNSWYDFAKEGNSSFITYDIQKTIYGNALDVQTDSFKYSSYLRIGLLNFSYGKISMVFAWNSNVSASLTLDNIIASANNTALGGISFGPYIGYRSKVWNETWSSNIGNEPGDGLYRLNLTYNNFYDMLSFSLKSLTSNNISIETSIRPSLPYSDNLSLTFGGMLSNISILTISEFNRSAFFPEYAKNVVFNSTSYEIPDHWNPLNSSNTASYYASQTNNLIYLTENLDIVDFNTVNNSFFVLFNTSGLNVISFNGLVVLSGNLDFKFGTEDHSLMVSVNLTTLKVSSFVPNLRESTGQLMFSFLDYIAVTTDYGNTSLFSYSDGIFTPIGDAIPFWTGNRLLYAGFVPGAFISIVLNSSDFQVIEYYQYLGGAALKVQSIGFLNSFSRGITFEGYDVSCRSITALLAVDNSSEVAFYNSSSGFLALPLLLGEGIMGNLTSYDSAVMSGNSLIYVQNDTVFSESADIKASRLLYGILNPGANSSLLITRSTIFLLYEKQFPLSNLRAALNANRSYLLTSNETEMVSVSSSAAYTLSVSFGNRTFVSENQSIYFDIYGIQEGEYNTTFIVRNIAGFSASSNVSFYIDDYPSLLNLSVNDGSYISNFTFIHYKIYNRFGISYAVANFSGRSEILNDVNGTLLIDLPNFNGTLYVNFTLKDGLGVRSTYLYIFHVISIAKPTINISSGEIFNTTVISLVWTELYQAKYYTVAAFNGTETIYNTLTNKMILDLGNGNWKIDVSAILLDNSNYTIFIGNITIIAFAPSLTVLIPSFSEYSFFGDSLNNSLYLSVWSNVSSSILIRVFSPEGKMVLSVEHLDPFNLTFENYSIFSRNGIYKIKVEAVTGSGTFNSSFFQINVNNTIPGAPFNKSIYYTNLSSFPVSPIIQKKVNYSTILYYSDTNINTTYGIPSDILLSRGTGSYTLAVNATSSSGNYNRSEIKIFYQNSTPGISFTVSSLNLVSTHFLNINYIISAEDPVDFIEVNYGNSWVKNYNPNLTGTISVNFSANGRYLLQMTVQDMCGNHASVDVGNFTVEYYVSISSARITSTWVIYGNYISLDLNGCVTGNLAISWYINGKYYGNGKEIYLDQPVGYNRISAVLSYDGKSQAVNATVLNLGFIPVLLASVIVGAAISIYELSRCRDEDKIASLIISNNGTDRKSLKKAARVERITSGKLNKVIRNMRESGKIRIEVDPDNNSYFIVNDDKKI